MGTAVVTGASSGIGRVIALELGRRGHHIIGAGRSEDRTGPTIEQIQEEGGTAEFLHLDLASLESSRTAAHSIEDSKIELLVNNAGVGAKRGLTSDGFEIHFGINHLGHFMFTHHLLRRLRDGARVVQVSSAAHQSAPGIDFDRVRQRTRSLLGLREYSVSKLANILFARELAKREPRIHTYALHPGLVDTNIIPALARPFLRRSMLTPEEGADTPVWCATSDELSDETGHYYSRRRAVTPAPPALDDRLANQLWEHSARWCGLA